MRAAPPKAALLALALAAAAPRAQPAPSRPAATIAFEDSVHALVVFVRFADDEAAAPEWPIAGAPGLEAIPPWAEGIVREDPAAVRASMPRDDRSLSAYFFRQSEHGPRGPLVFTGEVWPRRGGRPHVFTPAGPSTAYRGGRGTGYGYLVAELFEALEADPAWDAARFDANRDGELDHLLLVVRRDPAVTTTGGVASLAGVDSRTARTFGRPAARLTVGRPGRTVEVDLGSFGSGSVSWVGGEYALPLLAHEVGHVLFDMGHTQMITPPGAAVRSPRSNDAPAAHPEAGGAYGCEYARMCGGGAVNGRPTESSGYSRSPTLSGLEMRRMGWARRIVLDPSRDTSVVVRPLFWSGDVALVPLPAGAAGDTLGLESRQRTNPFDRFPPWDLDDPFYGLVYRDLMAEGLLATLSLGRPDGPPGQLYYDVLRPSDRVEALGSRCDGTSEGCVHPYAPWAGDLLRDAASSSQLTPWTRPNVLGHSRYPEGQAAAWFAVTDVRYVGRDGTMAFDLVADVRGPGGVEVTADSWMGRESDGLVLRGPVRVARGATLTVGEGATVTFAGGLDVEAGSAFVCERGATCVGAE